MLLHSRSGSGDHRPVEINAVVEEPPRPYLSRCPGREAGVAQYHAGTFVDPAAGEVDVFPQEITRVLLNLIANGFYAATKQKGRARRRRLRTHSGGGHEGPRRSRRDQDPRQWHGYSAQCQRQDVQSVLYNRTGRKGTGLGLSISHDIIVKTACWLNRGRYTAPGKFTEFSSYTSPRTAASLAKSGA